MAKKVLIFGASYGALLGTKLAMAGHCSTLVCLRSEADLINRTGTEVRIRLRGEEQHRAIMSSGQPGKLDAVTPDECNPGAYDLAVFAMQEPQYRHHALSALLTRVAGAGLPCLSIMNMPLLPFLRRLKTVNYKSLYPAYSEPKIWEQFEPGRVTLCSPDPQAFRPPEEAANVLHVGLPTNFKSAPFQDPDHTELLRELELSIDAIRLDGKDVPVKLRVFESLFVPMAKWPMLLTGNYRCVTDGGVRSIAEAVHDDLGLSRRIYDHVVSVAQALGARDDDLVPFQKYAEAAKMLLKPSSAARGIIAGAQVERVDKLVQILSHETGRPHPEIDLTVKRVDAALASNAKSAV